MAFMGFFVFLEIDLSSAGKESTCSSDSKGALRFQHSFRVSDLGIFWGLGSRIGTLRGYGVSG